MMSGVCCVVFVFYYMVCGAWCLCVVCCLLIVDDCCLFVAGCCLLCVDCCVLCVVT